MAKATKKRTRTSVLAIPRKKPRPKPTSRRLATPRAETKQARAIVMLRSAKGASIDALMEATGWQQHSVRGFLAGVVRKRLGLELQSTKLDGCRRYRIVVDDDADAGSAAGARS
jgi:hypothetical protein